jgi:hypothetical protein
MPMVQTQSQNPDFHADFSHGEAADCLSESAAPIEHHCQVCPTCGHRLGGHRCKLVCAHCGYYMSCADYY